MSFRRCLRTEFRQRYPCFSCLRVVEHCMTLAESSPAGVLTTQTHTRSFKHERTKSSGFSKGPVQRQVSFAHLRASRELAHHFWINVESFGHHGNLVSNTADDLRTD